MKRERMITVILMELGTPCNIKGYKYIKQAVTMILEDDSYLDYMTKGLYPDLAKMNNTTSSRVERAIRHAIEVTFDVIRPEIVEKYFGNSIDPNKGKPVNSHFLASIAEHIRNIYGSRKSAR